MKTTRRPDHNRLYLCLLCVMILASVLLLNLIAGKLPDSIKEFDVSVSGMYTLSRQSRDVLQGLDTQVSLNLICTGENEDARLTRLLKKYAAESDHIAVAYIDPVLTPDFVAAYTKNRVSDNSIIVTTEDGRYQLLRNSDLFPSVYDTETGLSSTGFDGEGQITAAINNLSSGSAVKLYAVTGHGEDDLGDSMSASLRKEGIDMEELRLLTVESVPADAGCLLINGPASDISEGETVTLQTYLEHGGKLLIITSNTVTDTPNLDRLLSGYGLTSIKGLILETDSDHYVPTYPSLLLPSILESEITDPISESGNLVLFPNAYAIVKAEDIRGSLTVTPLLKTSEKSYIKPSDATTYAKEEGDEEGPFYTAIAASENTSYGETRFVWFSCNNFLNEDVDAMVSGSNSDLFLNALGYLTHRESAITIRPKQQYASPVRLTSSQAAAWGAVFVLLLPAGVLAAGAVVSIRRKKRV